MIAPQPIDQLAACLVRLPGIGRRSAERFALHLARQPEGLARDLAQAIERVRAEMTVCSQCGYLTARERNPCRLCVDPSRDDSRLCVVEEVGDIAAIEQSGGYRGRYHALLGRLSPQRGTGPADLRVKELLRRVDAGGVAEVILALNTDVESDATASYLVDCLRGRPVRVTRLAFGLPAGSGIVYADGLTLSRAMSGRQPAE